MREKLKNVFLLGLGVATYGLNKDNRKKMESFVGELIEEGKITLTEGRILVDELVDESKKAAAKVKGKAKKVSAKVSQAREKAKGKVKKKR